MATLQVYQEMGKHVEKEVIGSSILPHLWHLALGPNLKVDQVRQHSFLDRYIYSNNAFYLNKQRHSA